MTNRELIKEYIRWERRYNACNHLGYTDDELINYSTCICKIDRGAKCALVNSRKYSTTTSKIQGLLRSELSSAGFAVEEYEGDPCYYWNAGYMGAPTVTVREFRPDND